MDEKREQSGENREGEVIESEFELKDGRKGVIRFAKREDAEGLVSVDIDRAEFRLKTYKMEEHYKKPLEKGTVGEETKMYLEKSIAGTDEVSFIVLEVGDEIIGYVDFKLESAKSEWGEGAVRICTLSIKEACMGQGCGRELLRKAVEKAKELYGAKRVVASTDNWNKPAIRLYRSEKFEQPEDAVPKKDWDGSDSPRMVFDPTEGKEIVAKRVKMVKNLEK